MFSDSLSLLTLLNSNVVVNELKSLLNDIQCLSSYFLSIVYVFIPRSVNVVADTLAKAGLVSINDLSNSGV